jgi:hypothetical protein
MLLYSNQEPKILKDLMQDLGFYLLDLEMKGFIGNLL